MYSKNSDEVSPFSGLECPTFTFFGELFWMIDINEDLFTQLGSHFCIKQLLHRFHQQSMAQSLDMSNVQLFSMFLFLEAAFPAKKHCYHCYY